MERKKKRSERLVSTSDTKNVPSFEDILATKMTRRRAISTAGKVAIGAAVAVVAAGGVAAYYAGQGPKTTYVTTTQSGSTVTLTPTGAAASANAFYYTEVGSQTAVSKLGPDPAFAGDAIPMWGGLLWETLWKIDPIAYKTNQLKVIPWLVDTYDMSSDGMTHDITIKKGVKFHTGKEMVADDVVFSLNRVFFYTYPTDIIGGTVLPLAVTPNITSITSTGTYSLEIKTKLAEPTLPNELVFSCNGIIDSQAAQANAVKGANGGSDYGFTYMFLDFNDILSGPYKIKSWVQQQRYELEKFSDWWGGPAGKQPGFDTVVELATIDDVSARISLQRGDLDMISDLSPSTWVALQSISGFTELNPPQPLSMCLITKGTSGPLADWRVRKALKMSIDYNDINSKLMQGATYWCESLFGYPTPGYEANQKYFPGADYAGAKSLLTDAGYANGFTLDYFARPAPRYGVNFINVGEALNTYWANIGVTATIKVYEVGEFYSLMFDPGTAGSWLLPGGTPNTPVPVYPDQIFNPDNQKEFYSFTPDLLPNDQGAQAYFNLQSTLLPKAQDELLTDKAAAIKDFQTLEASWLENGPSVGLIALGILSSQTNRLSNYYPVYDDYAEMVLYGASKTS